MRTPGQMNPENSRASFRKRFSSEVWVVEATSESGLEELKICKYALNRASELSETKASCPMPGFAFSVLADLLVLPASWSGADASHTSELNTSSTHLLRDFRILFDRLSTHKSRFYLHEISAFFLGAVLLYVTAGYPISIQHATGVSPSPSHSFRGFHPSVIRWMYPLYSTPAPSAQPYSLC